jgi:hypothetical protein
MDAPSGMLVAFATAPGSVAYDGEGVNGVYTKHLLRNLTLPGMPVELVLKRVREGVSKDTEGKQIPWESSSLLGDFYFKVAAAQQSSAALGQVDSTAVELAFWDSVKASSVPAEYAAYLEEYPQGRFAALARARIRTVEEKEPPPAVAPEPEQIVPALLGSPGGTRAASTLVRVGDAWTYNLLDGARRIDTVTVMVTAVDGDRIQDWVTRGRVPTFSAVRTFKSGFDPTGGFQEVELPGKFFVVEFSPYLDQSGIPALGKEWKDITAELTIGTRSGPRQARLDVRAVEQEKIRVAAGEFTTIRVEARVKGYVDFTGGGTTRAYVLKYWYSPELHRVVKMSRRVVSDGTRESSEDILELASFRQPR